jgi:hypothetical protein
MLPSRLMTTILEKMAKCKRVAVVLGDWGVVNCYCADIFKLFVNKSSAVSVPYVTVALNQTIPCAIQNLQQVFKFIQNHKLIRFATRTQKTKSFQPINQNSNCWNP